MVFCLHKRVPISLLTLLALFLIPPRLIAQENRAKSFGHPNLVINIGSEILGEREVIPYRPYSITFDKKGRIIVGDTGKPEALIFDKDGKFIQSLSRGLSDELQFLGELGGVAVDSKNRIFMVDTHNHKIKVFDETGKFIFMFGCVGKGNGEFVRPRGITIDPLDKVYIVDEGRGDVQVFDKKGRFLQCIRVKSEEQERCVGAEWICIGKTGSIYVTHDRFPGINVYSPQGDFIFSFGDKGTGAGQFEDDIEGIAINEQGHLFMVDEDEGRIEVFNESGEALFSLGQGIGTEPGQFLSPKGVDIDVINNKLAVADTWNSRIQVFNIDGLFKE